MKNINVIASWLHSCPFLKKYKVATTSTISCGACGGFSLSLSFRSSVYTEYCGGDHLSHPQQKKQSYEARSGGRYISGPSTGNHGFDLTRNGKQPAESKHWQKSITKNAVMKLERGKGSDQHAKNRFFYLVKLQKKKWGAGVLNECDKEGFGRKMRKKRISRQR